MSEIWDEDDGSERDSDERDWAVISIMLLLFHQVTVILSVFVVLILYKQKALLENINSVKNWDILGFRESLTKLVGHNTENRLEKELKTVKKSLNNINQTALYENY